ncbi:MAG: hypothetical protein FJ399_01165 [Verrucomicrobia bacterium]|nr:hypothetical protein [Verrucomicrobiota bacterium]
MSSELIPASLGIVRAEKAIFAQRRRGNADPADWPDYLNAAQVVLAYAQDFNRAQSIALFDIRNATSVIGAARILDAAAAGFLEKWKVQADEETKSLVFSYSALAASGYAISGNFPAAQTVLKRALFLWPANAPLETALLACSAPAILGAFYDFVRSDRRALGLVEMLAAFLSGQDPGGHRLRTMFDAVRKGLVEPFEQTLWMAGRAVLHQVENLSTAGLLQQKTAAPDS